MSHNVSSNVREEPNGDIVYEYNEHRFEHSKFETPRRAALNNSGGSGYKTTLGNQSMI